MEDKSKENIESLDDEEVLDTNEPSSSNNPMLNTMTADWRELSKSKNLKTKHRGLKIFLTIFIILFIFVGAIFAYFEFLKPDSQKLYDCLIKNYSSSVSKALNNTAGKNNSVYAQEGSIVFNTNIDEYKMLDGVSLTYLLGVDTNSKMMDLSLGYKENNKKVLDADLYFQNDKVYIKSDQIYDKLLFVQNDTDENDWSTTFSADAFQDIQYLFDKSSLYLRKALSNATYKTEFDKLVIKDKKRFVQKNTMIINSSNINDIKNSFINNIKNDNKFLEVLKKEYDYKDDELIKLLEEELKNDASKDFKTINIETYTMFITNKILSFNLTEGNDTLIKLISNGKKSYNVEFENELKGTLTVNSSNDISFETNYENYKVFFELITTKSKDSYQIISKITDSNGKTMNISFKSGMSSKTFKSISVEKAVDVANMNQNELAKLEENLTKVFNNSDLLKTFMSNYDNE